MGQTTRLSQEKLHTFDKIRLIDDPHSSFSGPWTLQIFICIDDLNA